MASPSPCYLCRLLCPTKFRPSPLITVNDRICQACLDTFPQAGNLVDAFHLPLPVAAHKHGLSPSKFQSPYKRRGITKWPYRWLRHPNINRDATGRFVELEDVMDDVVACLAADEDLRAVPTVVRTNLPTEVPTATPTPVLTAAYQVSSRQ